MLKQVYNQQIVHLKDGKHTCMFRLSSVAIFREYQYLNMYIALLYSFGTCKW